MRYLALILVSVTLSAAEQLPPDLAAVRKATKDGVARPTLVHTSTGWGARDIEGTFWFIPEGALRGISYDTDTGEAQLIVRDGSGGLHMSGGQVRVLTPLADFLAATGLGSAAGGQRLFYGDQPPPK